MCLFNSIRVYSQSSQIFLTSFSAVIIKRALLLAEMLIFGSGLPSHDDSILVRCRSTSIYQLTELRCQLNNQDRQFYSIIRKQDVMIRALILL